MGTFSLTGLAVESFMAVISGIILLALLTERQGDDGIDGFLIVAFETNFAMIVCDMVYRLTSGILVAQIVFSILSEILLCITFILYASFCVSYLGSLNLVRRARKMLVPAVSIILLTGILLWCLVSLIISGSDYSVSLRNFHWITYVFSMVASTYLIIYFLSKIKYLGVKTVVVLSITALIPLAMVSTEPLFEQTLIYASVTPTLLIIYTQMHMDKVMQYISQKKKIAEQEVELTSQRNRIMVSQMQPHFMYNVLNSIYYLCEKDTEEAQEAISTFSDYLRMNMDAMGKNDLVTFPEELRHVKTYLMLEKMRFDERLNVNYDIKATDFKLPCLTLQPMVENAVKHGICKKPTGGTVTISTYEIDNYFVIEIIDDGIGYDPNNIVKNDGRSHVGRESVKNRIEAMCGGRVEFVSEIGKGSITAIYIPKEGNREK